MPPDAPLPDLTPTARLVLLALDEARQDAWRPLDTTALRARTRTPKASFFRAIALLESCGLVIIVRTPGLPNVYARGGVPWPPGGVM